MNKPYPDTIPAAKMFSTPACLRCIYRRTEVFEVCERSVRSADYGRSRYDGNVNLLYLILK